LTTVPRRTGRTAIAGTRRYHSGAMHLTILLIVGAGLVFLVARALATPGAVLHDRVASGWAIGIGVVVGIACALIALSTQMDMVPDDLEAAVLPLVIIVVSVALGIGAWYRTFRS